MVYEVVVVEKATVREQEDGKLERLVLGPVVIVAANEQAAALNVLADNDAIKDVDKSKMDILVRPFA